MKKFRVVLPIEFGGRIYAYGDTVEMTVADAKEYSHALIAVDEEEK